MNYFKQVAEMLGVELNEKFMLKDKDNEFLPRAYKFTDEGLFYEFCETWERSCNFMNIIRGYLTVVKSHWKPKYEDKCYFYGKGRAMDTVWIGTACDYARWKVGNCFRTEQEAETKGKEIMEQIEKEFRES